MQEEYSHIRLYLFGLFSHFSALGYGAGFFCAKQQRHFESYDTPSTYRAFGFYCFLKLGLVMIR